jgi:hypothetical protein
MPQATLALDRSSARTYDVDGRLRVEASNITKATVNPYFGKEIPGWESLGLEPSRIYNMLRDPAELEKAAESFTNIPLLIIHKGTTADNHDKEVVVGTVGDARWEAPYVKASLCVWTEEAIAGIQSKQQTELSCGYRYRPDMTPGTYDGVEYDGVMRDIIGNHVALVEVGRAGSDVVVADSNPFNEAIPMKQQQRLNAAQAQARQALGLAEDADLSKLTPILMSLMAKDEDMDDKAEDGVDDDDEEEKKRKAKEASGASDEPGTGNGESNTEGGPKANTKQAMDAAIKAASAQVKADMLALADAQRQVAPLVGHVALDSADAVLRFALDHAKVEHKDIKEVAALKALVSMHLSAASAAPAPRMGLDSATVQSADKRFDQLGRFGKI